MSFAGRVRLPAIAAAGYVALLGLLAATLPQGLPPGLVLRSSILGLLAALNVAGLVLVYRSSGLVNFAQIAMGSAGAALVYELAVHREFVPYVVALVAGVLTGPLLGLLVGAFISVLFFKHPRLVVTIVTIIAAAVLVSVETGVVNLFRVPDEVRRIQPVLGPLPDRIWEVGGYVFRAGHLIALVVAMIAIVGLGLFLSRARFGIAIRGTAENADRASLLGVNVKLVTTGVWVMAGLASALASTLALPLTNYSPGRASDHGLLLPLLTAGVVGRMTSLPVSMAAAFAITILRSAVLVSYGQAIFVDVALLAVMLVVLLARKRKPVSRRLENVVSWEAYKEVRPTPRELLRLRPLRLLRRAGGVLAVIALLAFPWLVPAGTRAFAGDLMLTSMAALSVVILVGWAGQLSLGQLALVGVGAFAEGILAGRLGWPFVPTVMLAALTAAAAAVLVGLPALRIRGLFLAVSTFAMAVVLPQALFDEKALGRFLPTDVISRPKFLFLNFLDERSMYYLLLGVTTLAFAGARALRKGRTGRILVALRDDEAGAQAFGIDPMRVRLQAFALSGFVAGLSGALLVHVTGRAGPDLISSFNVNANVQLFIVTVVGGVGSIVGPILGVFYYLGIGRLLAARPEIAQALTSGLMPIVVLLFLPGGLVSALAGVRDAILRVVAVRNRILVPSLFADYSPEAWERMKAPLKEPAPGRGLGALPAGTRFSLGSKLWGKVGT